MRKWKTKDGTLINIKDMHTEHIKNVLQMYKDKGYISLSTSNFYFNCKPPQGDMAQFAFENELMKIIDSPVSAWIDIFEQELERRNNEQ